MHNDRDKGLDGFYFVHFAQYEKPYNEIDALDVAKLWKIEGYLLQRFLKDDLVLLYTEL